MRALITDKHLLEMMWDRFPEIMKRGIEHPAQQEPAGVKFNEGLWQEREARIAQLEAELMRMQGRELKLQFALAEQPAQQEPVAWLKVTEHWLSGMPKLEIAKPQEQGAKPVYLNPYQLT